MCLFTPVWFLNTLSQPGCLQRSHTGIAAEEAY
jgi:hypothetical protein